MLRYILVMLLCAMTYSMSLGNEADPTTDGLEDSKVSNRTVNSTSLEDNLDSALHEWLIEHHSNVDIPSGYVITSKSSAHKFHNRRMPWNTARKMCVAEGGHLLILNSYNEEELIMQIVDKHEGGEIWIGTHDLYQEGEWNTILDKALESTGYTKWRPGEPNNYGGVEHCGTLVDRTGMNDLECTKELHFICERSF